MVLLFLLALLLAWPTAGISLIVYAAFAILKGIWRAKARMHSANEHRAGRRIVAGERKAPSWAGDIKKNEIFVEAIQARAAAKGVPQAFLWAALGDRDTFETLAHFAGAMELEGASFLEQQVAVADRLVDIWERLPLKVKMASLGD